ncbi:MAG: polysaccharide deacetylase family protein [Leptospirales bacterium]
MRDEKNDWFPPILYYHRVAPGVHPDLGVTPDAFRAQIRVLKGLGFQGITLKKALGIEGLVPTNGIVISFDDGYLDNFEYAAPILDEFGYRGTVFCVSGKMGQLTDWAVDPLWVGLPLMTREQARELHENGFEIGSHTQTHPMLTRIGEEAALSELLDSRTDLEDLLGAPVPTFCYPYGDWDPSRARLVSEAGYLGARTTEPLWSWTRPKRDFDRFSLPCRSVSGYLSFMRFAGLSAFYRLLEG